MHGNAWLSYDKLHFRRGKKLMLTLTRRSQTRSQREPPESIEFARVSTVPSSCDVGERITTEVGRYDVEA